MTTELLSTKIGHDELKRLSTNIHAPSSIQLKKVVNDSFVAEVCDVLPHEKNNLAPVKTIENTSGITLSESQGVTSAGRIASLMQSQKVFTLI